MVMCGVVFGVRVIINTRPNALKIILVNQIR